MALGRVALSAFLFLAISAVVFAGVPGALVLDNYEIQSCMPVTGFIEIVPQSDLELQGEDWAAFDFGRGGFDIELTPPSGEAYLVTRSFDRVGCYGPAMGTSVLRKGVRYAFPIFILKVYDRFLFEKPGIYILSYKLHGITGEPEFSASVRVVEGDAHARSQFVSICEGRSVAIEPFCDVLLRTSGALPDSNSPYFDAYLALVVNQLGGQRIGRRLVSKGFGGLEEEVWARPDRLIPVVERGLAAESLLPVSRGIWSALAQRTRDRDNYRSGDWGALLDLDGRVLVVTW